ncbi:hypothetical protein [Pontibacter akesuensis]|uniref:Uncharacterized protein n=1 Tax=Pontibacter akesuensis TaxID=388950 RepID=A0A1I7KEK2_9BACT|nr:hypothetical protein [Pontibacter akesuensis]GHA79814.1 hypothetical protein GCM10007389_37570 [Pontibacter akesuensis]SFU95843.1 hypothetical protein SAMN04487941_3633 [Pontibacter akesuensis]
MKSPKNRYERRTRYVFGGASNFWFLFVAIGVFVWLSPLFLEQEGAEVRTMVISGVALLLGLSLRFTYYGIQINRKRRSIREFISILGYKSGEWKTLPDLKKLRLSAATSTTQNIPNGISPTMRRTITVYSIALFSAEATPDYVIHTESKKEAMKVAKALANVLGLQVEDNL